MPIRFCHNCDRLTQHDDVPCEPGLVCTECGIVSEYPVEYGRHIRVPDPSARRLVDRLFNPSLCSKR